MTMMVTMTKKLQIGQRQASRICPMSAANRLAFIADGLPIIHASAMGSSAQLRENPRAIAEESCVTRVRTLPFSLTEHSLELYRLGGDGPPKCARICRWPDSQTGDAEVSHDASI